MVVSIYSVMAGVGETLNIFRLSVDLIVDASIRDQKAEQQNNNNNTKISKTTTGTVVENGGGSSVARIQKINPPPTLKTVRVVWHRLLP